MSDVRYTVLNHIDKPHRLLGIETRQFSMSMMIFCIGVMTRHPLIGAMVTAAVWITVWRLKKRHGFSGTFKSLLRWFTGYPKVGGAPAAHLKILAD